MGCKSEIYLATNGTIIAQEWPSYIKVAVRLLYDLRLLLHPNQRYDPGGPRAKWVLLPKSDWQNHILYYQSGWGSKWGQSVGWGKWCQSVGGNKLCQSMGGSKRCQSWWWSKGVINWEGASGVRVWSNETIFLWKLLRKEKQIIFYKWKKEFFLFFPLVKNITTVSTMLLVGAGSQAPHGEHGAGPSSWCRSTCCRAWASRRSISVSGPTMSTTRRSFKFRCAHTPESFF